MSETTSAPRVNVSIFWYKILDDNQYYYKKVHNHELIKAFSAAYKWKKLLNNGKYSSTEEIADHKNINPRHVRRLLRLNYVAPDIIESIINGKHNPDLRLVQFYKNPIPASWDEQRELYC